MIDTQWYHFRLWQFWRRGILLIGLLLTVAACGGKIPPRIKGFTPPSPDVTVNEAISIQVDYDRNDHRVDDFLWSADEGKIIGNGKSLITYQAPDTPGYYEISVQLKYSGGTVEDSMMVEVVSDQVDTPTSTATSTEPPTAVPTVMPSSTLAIVPTLDTVDPTDTPISPMTPTSEPMASTTPTRTPEPNATSTLAVTATRPTPTGTRPASTATLAPRASPAAIATQAPAAPAGEFVLLKPAPPGISTPGQTEFEWQWNGAVEAGQGFEVRVWREGEPPAGVHNAVEDNLNGRVESLNDNTYRLSVDITNADGVQGRSGEYLWTVLLVQVSPEYQDLGIQATPGRLRFEAGDGGDGDGNGGPIF